MRAKQLVVFILVATFADSGCAQPVCTGATVRVDATCAATCYGTTPNVTITQGSDVIREEPAPLAIDLPSGQYEVYAVDDLCVSDTQVVAVCSDDIEVRLVVSYCGDVDG